MPLDIRVVRNDTAALRLSERRRFRPVGCVDKILELDSRPSEKEARVLAESWSPHRGAAALLTWHVYNNPAL